MPENIKTAWKVARKDGDGWKSAIVNGKACVRYAIGERSYGFEGTPVTVFKSAQSALAWRSDMVLLVGKAGNVRPVETLFGFALYDGLRAASVLAFWRNPARCHFPMSGPLGACLADWFEPEKVVCR